MAPPQSALGSFEGGMNYWIYESWTRDRGRIHRADCGFCNEGQGTQVKAGDRNGRWHGPFDRDAAFAKAAQLNRADTRACSICDP
jgi:hypothetical protein